jgi:hypothetical protein
VYDVLRSALFTDAYQLAADTVSRESLKIEDLEDVRQDLQSALVEQCGLVISERRQGLSTMNNKLTGVQSLLMYTDSIASKVKPSTSESTTFSPAKTKGATFNQYRPDKSNLRSVAMMNEKIIEVSGKNHNRSLIHIFNLPEESASRLGFD